MTATLDRWGNIMGKLQKKRKVTTNEPENDEATIHAVEKLLDRFNEGFSSYFAPRPDGGVGGYEALKFVVVGDSSKSLVMVLPKERLLLWEGDAPHDLHGVLADKYNTGVYAAVEALWRLGFIDASAHAVFRRHLANSEARRKRESSYRRLRDEAAALGLRLEPQQSLAAAEEH